MVLPIFVRRSRSFVWLMERVEHASDECLIWPFSKNWNGYGHLKAFEQPTFYAHRVMCELAHGAPPTTSHVAAHSCGKGQQGCVNPRHLGWKSPAENQLDRRLHGTNRRKTKWTRNGSLVSDEARAQICALKGVKNQREIAAMFGISYQHVSLIQRGLRRQPKRVA
jgi:hypothetical protein